MTIIRFAAAAAAIGGMATPALAQYQPYPQQYPQYQQQYPQYQQQYPQYQQQYQQQGIAGIIGQLLGNRYTAVNDRTAIAQCAAAAQQQAAVQYRPRYNQGYNQPYMQSTARVTGITNVERRQNGLRVSGVMSSGRNYGAYQQGYNGAYAGAVNDLTFRCIVDYRGAVTNIRIRQAGYRG